MEHESKTTEVEVHLVKEMELAGDAYLKAEKELIEWLMKLLFLLKYQSKQEFADLIKEWWYRLKTPKRWKQI